MGKKAKESLLFKQAKTTSKEIEPKPNSKAAHQKTKLRKLRRKKFSIIIDNFKSISSKPKESQSSKFLIQPFLAQSKKEQEKSLAKFHVRIPPQLKYEEDEENGPEVYSQSVNQQQQESLSNSQSLLNKEEGYHIQKLTDKILNGQRNESNLEEFGRAVEKHLQIKFQPIPLSEFGVEALSDGRFVLAFYRLIVGEEDNPFLMEHVLNFIDENYVIKRNKKVLAKERSLNKRKVESMVESMKGM